MSKSFRVSVVFAGLIALVLGLSQVALASGTVTQTQDPTATNPETKSRTSQTKSRKRKKKKSAATPSFVVLGTYVQPTVAEPINSTPITTPTAPVPATPARSGVRVAQTSTVRILPTDETPTNVATAGQLVISEFRVRGPNGLNDEFIEIANVSGADHTVAALSGTGYGIAASNGVTRCSIPTGTVIPNLSLIHI